jgi:heme/copper-type cytochrome/quinol oxidase subunit 3
MIASRYSSPPVPTAVGGASAAANGAGVGEGAGEGAGKIGMWIFLATDAMGFGALLVAYAVLRARADAWPDPIERLSIPLAAAMTLTLLTSSLTVLFALTAARQGRGGLARRWLAATIVGALAFLAGQAFEYHHLLAGGRPMALTSDLFASTFYVVTGFHGLHVIAGVVVLASVLGRGGPGAPPPAAVEVASLFWHFVDLAWVAIFTFVYLLPVR